MILGAIAPQEAAQVPAYTCDPALTRLFTPPRPLLGRYEVCTTIQPIEEFATDSPEGLRDGTAVTPGGVIEALEALDAFGGAGTYRRAALARVYGGTRVRLTRSWSSSGGTFTSVTRLSPYPDAALTRLQPGTMEIRFTLER